MSPLWAPTAVLLISSFATQPLCGSPIESSAAFKEHRTSNGTVSDIHVAAKPVPMGQTLGTLDGEKQLCCGPINDKRILPRRSKRHMCCGHDQFDPLTHCCCGMTDFLQIEPLSNKCCGENSAQTRAPGAKEDVSDLCLMSNVVNQLTPERQYCGEVPFDVAEQLCCGPKNRNKVLPRKSSRHQCCSNHDQYDPVTECCCMDNGYLAVRPINSPCCQNDPDALPRLPAPRPHWAEPHTRLCGSSCYNPNEFHCCEREQTTSHWCCNSGLCDATPTVYDPRTHVCCDGCLSDLKPWIDQCCGPSPYGLAQRRVLCWHNNWYNDRGDEMRNPRINPAKGTVCCSLFHGSLGQHCCGTETYRPQAEICCNGHRHPKVEHGHCCGIHTYNIKDPHMKCCAQTLYNVSNFVKHGQEAQCCGSILRTPQNQDVCCSSEDGEILYCKKEGFRCCGHRYIHTAVWSCCAGKLRPAHQPGQDQAKMNTESVANLNKTDLCEEMKVGTVESVSLHSIVFMGVLKIHGINATVEALPSPYVLDTPGRCNSPLLIPGQVYFFKGFNVFTDFSHDNPLLSVHFIISTCYHP